ncbi:MAG: hypothetical protein M3R47_12975 [Chloroflexota bacterium]|nr:hypothetical protein [Chloroflexota bacterium]
MTSPSASSPNRLDLRVILETPLRQFVPWLAMVLLVTFAGYPGVVCVTPMAWLIALRVGNLCVWRSRSRLSSRRLTEAALAGGLLGFLQGLLFAGLITLLEPINADERTRTIILTLILNVAGIFAGAALSFVTAYLNERRRNQAEA